MILQNNKKFSTRSYFINHNRVSTRVPAKAYICLLREATACMQKCIMLLHQFLLSLWYLDKDVGLVGEEQENYKFYMS